MGKLSSEEQKLRRYSTYCFIANLNSIDNRQKIKLYLLPYPFTGEIGD
jgi:hypothetical protein